MIHRQLINSVNLNLKRYVKLSVLEVWNKNEPDPMNIFQRIAIKITAFPLCILIRLPYTTKLAEGCNNERLCGKPIARNITGAMDS